MKYRVEIDTLDHDKKRLAPGDVIELTKAQADQLLACGAVSEVKPASKKDKE